MNRIQLKKYRLFGGFNSLTNYFIMFLSLFCSEFFFSTCAILGINLYDEGNDSQLFMFFSIILAICVCVMYGITLLKSISSDDVRGCCLIFLILALFFLESPGSEAGQTLIKTFIGKSIPAILIVLIVCKRGGIDLLFSFFNLLMIVLSIGLAFNFRNYTDGDIGLAGGSYQALSYYAAFAYAINILLMFVKEKKSDSVYSKINIVLSYAFIPIQICSCIIGGGRGAMIFLILSTLYVMWLKRNSIMRHKLTLIVLTLAIFFLTLKFIPYDYFVILESGSERAFSYLSDSGIDMSDTSNRDIVYGEMIDAFFERPLIGYGIFKYIDIYGTWAHNFFLEILVQGGLVFFTICFVMAIRAFFRWKSLPISSENKSLFNIILMFSFVKLFFSGSYLMDPLFWFVIMFIFLYQTTSVSYNC
ncbi:MAG: O-antigen ligase family protein [Bacteroidaceae bacterium]|nr:O-antigen ligase family protein [Bacteroidaceae bacterium]